MPNLWVHLCTVNKTTGERYGEGGEYETQYDVLGDLYRALRREYGRCTGAVYVDTVSGTKKVGWIFQSRQRYGRTRETYLQDVWVTVLQGPPVVKTTYQYVDFPR